MGTRCMELLMACTSPLLNCSRNQNMQKRIGVVRSIKKSLAFRAGEHGATVLEGVS